MAKKATMKSVRGAGTTLDEAVRKAQSQLPYPPQDISRYRVIETGEPREAAGIHYFKIKYSLREEDTEDTHPRTTRVAGAGCAPPHPVQALMRGDRYSP